MKNIEETFKELAIKATKKFIRNLEESDFVSNVGWRSAEELRQYAADIAFDIYSAYAGLDDYDFNQHSYFVNAFKDKF